METTTQTITLALTLEDADTLARAAFSLAETFAREADGARTLAHVGRTDGTDPAEVARREAHAAQAASLAARYRRAAHRLTEAGVAFDPAS
jgi:hypothetical protein